LPTDSGFKRAARPIRPRRKCPTIVAFTRQASPDELSEADWWRSSSSELATLVKLTFFAPPFGILTVLFSRAGERTLSNALTGQAGALYGTGEPDRPRWVNYAATRLPIHERVSEPWPLRCGGNPVERKWK
jgi:hypothetical protein